MSAPTGARATLMGSTGVALGRDGSAPFNNPASIVTIRDQRLAFSVNFYSLGMTNFDRWHQPGEVDTGQFGEHRLKSTAQFDTAFRSLPSTLCLFFTLEDLASQLSLSKPPAEESGEPGAPGRKLAICFATVESEDVDQSAISFRADTAIGPSTHVQSLQRRWVRIYIGPTYSVALSERLSIGGSVHVVYTYDSFGINSDSLNSTVGGRGVSSRLSVSGSGKSFELTGVLGATYKIGRYTLGASLRLPSLHVLGDYDGTFSRANSGDPDASVIQDATGSLRSAPLSRVALGVGAVWDRLTLEFDTSVGVPLQNTLTAELTVTESSLGEMSVERNRQRQRHLIGSQFTVNPSFGFEYLLSRQLGVMGGVSTNFSSLPPLRPEPGVGTLVQSRTHRVAAALGVGRYWEHGEILFGFQFEYGWGQAVAANPYIIPNDWAVIDIQSYTLLFVIAGSTNLGSIVRLVSAIAHGGEDTKDPPPDEKSEFKTKQNKQQ